MLKIAAGIVRKGIHWQSVLEYKKMLCYRPDREAAFLCKIQMPETREAEWQLKEPETGKAEL